MIDTVIFDLDGTLLDSLDDLMLSTNHALKTYGYPERTREEIRSFVGNGILRLIELATPNGRENPDFEKILAEMKSHYAIHCNDNTKPYDGILDLLTELKARKIKMAISTNKPDPQAKDLAQKVFLGLIPQEAAIGEAESTGRRRKPFPDSVEYALEVLGSRKENAVYVGDSDVDLATARNSGLRCISVTWGFRPKEFLLANGATTTIDNPLQLIDIINS